MIAICPATRKRTQASASWGVRLVMLLSMLAGAMSPAMALERADVTWPAQAAADPARRDAALAQVAQALLDADAAAVEKLSLAQRSHAQLVAGRDAEALVSIESLRRELSAKGERASAQRWMPWALFAEAEASGTMEFAQAYSAAFGARFADMDDVSALQTHYWFVGDPAVVGDQLQQSIADHADATHIPHGAALDMMRQAAFVRVYRATTSIAPALIHQDEARRFQVDDEVMIPAGDGIVLSAHVARSRTLNERRPAAMLFTIYTDPARNRNEAMLAAAHGYVGVVVDARGKRLGRGDIAPYEHEGEDANAAVDWISRQPWNDGRVVMYGGSYSGFAAWAAAKYRHPALKAIAPYVAAIPGLGLPMENNVFLTANYAWPFYVANTRLLDNDTYGQRGRWNAMARNWYLSGRPYRQIDVVDGTPNPWLQRWLSHPTYDAYWQRMVPYAEDFAGISIPVLSITGYYDDGQISALEYFKQHVHYRPGADHTLLIGPYDHPGAQSPVKLMQLRGYALDPVAQFDTSEITFQWFDHVLRGAPRPALLADRVNYQLMGADRWGHAPSLQDAAGDYLALHPSLRQEGGYNLLERNVSGPGRYLRQTVDLADRQVERHSYYPNPIIREAVQADTGLVFVSEAFAEPVDVVGTMSGDLKVRINKRDFDFSVTLYELMRDGRVMQLTYYVGRASHVRDMTTRTLLEPGKWVQLPFDRTRMTARRMAPGSRLMVVLDVLMDANHQVNLGTGRDVSDESAADAGPPLQVDWHTDSVIRVPWRPVPPDPAAG